MGDQTYRLPLFCSPCTSRRLVVVFGRSCACTFIAVVHRYSTLTRFMLRHSGFMFTCICEFVLYLNIIKESNQIYREFKEQKWYKNLWTALLRWVNFSTPGRLIDRLTRIPVTARLTPELLGYLCRNTTKYSPHWKRTRHRFPATAGLTNMAAACTRWSSARTMWVTRGPFSKIAVK